MIDIRHNLTRFWRSKTFEEIVGQVIPVRLLKNSLVKNRIFPVYLFSGLRGSGKTSIGRIFAAALNCEQLPQIQTEHGEGYDPSKACGVPCLKCSSCLLMRANEHPDFIEIDAASHTGVDNVRNIIESAALLPVAGRKKIYLIDEAHMLSKAAFNALLKILEEPPATVVFMLATTELHKIPDTVKSRSFQLFFEPIDHILLKNHLKKISENEGVVVEDLALDVIVRQSEGSARDALNTMERIIVTDGAVTYDAACRTLGVVRVEVVRELLEVISRGSVALLFEYLTREKYHMYNSHHVWHAVLQELRYCMQAERYPEDSGVLSARYTPSISLELIDMLYRSELQLIRTTSPWSFLEHLLCKICQRFGATNGQSEISHSPTIHQSFPVIPQKSTQSAAPPIDRKKTAAAEPATVNNEPSERVWISFLRELETSNNPIAYSLFKNAVWQLKGSVLQISLPKKFEFYHEWLVAQETFWKPLLNKLFAQELAFELFFVAENVSAQIGADALVYERDRASITARSSAMVVKKTESQAFDFDNEEKWKKIHTLKQVFPGTVRLNKE